MSIIKEIRWKDKSGKTVDYDVGVKASNVEQDASHRFVTYAEKQAWNGKPSADTQNLKTYTSLTQLEVSTPATMVQIYNALPENSYLLMNMENNNMVSDIPTGNGSGVLEVTKAGTARNFARYTPSLSTAGEAKGMYYGTFSWSGEAVFNGWKLLLDETRIANNDTTTQAGFAADARIVKTHGDEIDQLNSEINNLMIIKKIVVLENGNFPGNNSSHIAFTVDIPDGYSIISISSYSSIWTIQTTIATTLDGGYEVAIHNISTNAYDASIYVIVGLLKTM